MKLPGDKQQLLDNIKIDLQKIAGIKAIVLGGSYAAGTATDASDLDIGIYYSDEALFPIDEIRNIAKKYSVEKEATVTDFYEWGPWVNGGAWINTAGGKVDLLYKNIEQIASTIERAQNRVWENHFEQQPPYGFSSMIFLAETKTCVSLYDPEHIVQKLKSAVEVYPEKLKKAVVQQSLWSAEFTIWHADLFAAKNDVYNTVGCLARAVKNIVTALFSINEIYPMGDKRSIEILENAAITPSNLKEKVDGVLCAEKEKLGNNVALLKSLFSETVALTGVSYQPFYNL